MNTMASIKEMSAGYDREHTVTKEDVEKAGQLQEAIEGTLDDKRPTPGDIIICITPEDKRYEYGHLESLNGAFEFEKNCLSICTIPMTPFVSLNGRLVFSASGGYWISEKDFSKLKYIGTKEKFFVAWGHCGMRGNGAFTFTARVKVWEYQDEKVY